MYQSLRQGFHYLRYYPDLTDHPWKHHRYLCRNNPDLHFHRKQVLSVHLSACPMLLLQQHTARLYCRFSPAHRLHRSVLQLHLQLPDRPLQTLCPANFLPDCCLCCLCFHIRQACLQPVHMSETMQVFSFS